MSASRKILRISGTGKELTGVLIFVLYGHAGGLRAAAEVTAVVLQEPVDVRCAVHPIHACAKTWKTVHRHSH